MDKEDLREMATVYEYMMKNPTLGPNEAIARMFGYTMLWLPMWPDWVKGLLENSTSKHSTFRLRFLDAIFCELEISGYLKADRNKREQK